MTTAVALVAPRDRMFYSGVVGLAGGEGRTEEGTRRAKKNQDRMFYVDVQRRGRGELKKTGPDVIPGDVQRRGRGGLEKQDRIYVIIIRRQRRRGSGLQKEDGVTRET